MPLQVIFMGGSFEYSNMIGWRFEGAGPKIGPLRWIIHNFFPPRRSWANGETQDAEDRAALTEAAMRLSDY